MYYCIIATVYHKTQSYQILITTNVFAHKPDKDKTIYSNSKMQ